MRKGICRACGKLTDLTFEHIPAKASGNRRELKLVTMESWARGQRFEMFKRGPGVQSLCGSCNSFFGRWYVPAFLSWSRRGAEYLDRIGRDTTAFVPFTIQPLAVLKQIAVGAIALAHASSIHLPHYRLLRRAVLEHRLSCLSGEFRFFVYFAGLDTPRFSHGGYVLNAAKGTGAFVFAEVAFPPFGYCITDRAGGSSELVQSSGLCEISRFGEYEFVAIDTVHLRIPVLNNVGPGPLQYAPTREGWPKPGGHGGVC